MSTNDALNSTGYYSNKGSTWNATNTSNGLGGAISDSLVGGVTRALPTGFKTDVQSLSDYRLGTFLSNHRIVNGNIASVINGAIDFIKISNTKNNATVIPSFTHDQKFIPIVIKTEFNLAKASTENKRSPWYLIFDSTPDSFIFQKNANWSPKDFPGRPEPIQVYGNSGAQTFSLEGTFFSDSEEYHTNKLKIANSLMALVTPSKAHFMPSPVEVRIGNWKRLRCIVNSVTITYEGPWWMGNAALINGAVSAESLPTHAPYIFKANFSFTIVSEFNTLQYAEDILDYGDLGGFASTITENTEISAAIANSMIQYSNNPNFSSSGLTSQNIETVTITTSSADYNVNTAAYLYRLGLPTDSNGATKSGALAAITSGLTAEVQTAVLKNFGSQINKIFGK